MVYLATFSFWFILEIRAVTTDINKSLLSFFVLSYEMNLICGEESEVICQKICIWRPNANANVLARASDVEDMSLTMRMIYY